MARIPTRQIVLLAALAASACQYTQPEELFEKAAPGVAGIDAPTAKAAAPGDVLPQVEIRASGADAAAPGAPIPEVPAVSPPLSNEQVNRIARDEATTRPMTSPLGAPPPLEPYESAADKLRAAGIEGADAVSSERQMIAAKPAPPAVGETTPAPSSPTGAPAAARPRAADPGRAESAADRQSYLAREYPRVRIRTGASAEPTIQPFLQELERAIAARNVDALLALIDRTGIEGPGGDRGAEAFVSRWGLTYDARSSPLWPRLAEALALGVAPAAASDPSGFHAPAIGFTTDLSDDILEKNIRPEDRLLVLGQQVRVRAEPSTKGEMLAEVGWEVVKAAGPFDLATATTIGEETHPWWPVALPDGRRGWIWGKYVRPWLAERADFAQVDGQWRLVRFAPGAPL